MFTVSSIIQQYRSFSDATPVISLKMSSFPHFCCKILHNQGARKGPVYTVHVVTVTMYTHSSISQHWDQLNTLYVMPYVPVLLF